jgi:hypothetical protein
VIPERYVVGLLYDTDASHVLLQRLSHPPAQAGWFNGPGGQVHDGHNPDDVMACEFAERVCDMSLRWTHFATVRKGAPGLRGGAKAEVLFYRAFVDHDQLDACLDAVADGGHDPARILALHDLAAQGDVIPDILWLAQLGRHRDYFEVTALQWMPVPEPAPGKAVSRG